MISREATTSDCEETITRSRAIRAEHGSAAALYVNRVEQAHAAARSSAVAQWTDEYRGSAARCREHGEIIRRQREAA
jgi:hypothetical protein